MRKDLDNLIRRLVTRDSIVKTGPRLKYYLVVKDWIDSGLPGAIVTADMRFGKTYGTRWTLKTLGVPHVFIPMRSRTKPSEGGFFTHILGSVDHWYDSKGRIDERRDRVTKFFVGLAQRSPRNTIVIAFDEAHKISDAQYQWMLEIQNELELHGVSVFYLLVGQHRLRDVKMRLLKSGQFEITERFMMDQWELPGIASEVEVAECFADYHAIEVEGQSLSQLCAPRVAADGWTIEHLAMPMWRAFCEMHKSDAVHAAARGSDSGGESVQIPMHFLSHALANLLGSISRNKLFSGFCPEEDVLNAVKATHYAPLHSRRSVT